MKQFFAKLAGKLGSRKLWVTIGTNALALYLVRHGIAVKPETLEAAIAAATATGGGGLLALVVNAAYIYAQGKVDLQGPGAPVSPGTAEERLRVAKELLKKFQALEAAAKGTVVSDANGEPLPAASPEPHPMVEAALKDARESVGRKAPPSGGQ